MRIEYQAVGAVGGWVILADESVVALGARISGFQPVLDINPDVQTGIGAVSVTVFDRGNARWTLGFLVERSHATPDAAVTYVVDHAAIFTPIGNLNLRITQGGSVTYMANCTLTKLSPAPASDCSTRFTYGFIGGSYTKTPP